MKSRLEGNFLRIGLLWMMFLSTGLGAEIKTFHLSAKEEISVAEITVRFPEGKTPRGVLVLCPGENGDGGEFLSEKSWVNYARQEGLALVGIHFESSSDDLIDRRGYYVVERGSGALLEEGLKEAGLEDLPLYLYGFSGGAHFTISFASWHPRRVAGFCAYTFAWWDPPSVDLKCPALIACGQADGTRYGSALLYFETGRRQLKPWTWISLEDTQHERSARLDEFVRQFFACLLDEKKGGEVEVDNMTRKVVREKTAEPVASSILPCEKLLPLWQAIHFP